MATSQKVAEIFITAAEAFSHLGTMTMQLHPNPDSQPNSKWTSAEIDSLHAAVKNFGNDLNAIAERMKHRTVSQVKEKLKEQLLVANKTKDGADDEPSSKKAKLDVGSAPSTSRTEKSKGADDTNSDVDSVTTYPELQVDEEASSDEDEEDESEVDV